MTFAGKNKTIALPMEEDVPAKRDRETFKVVLILSIFYLNPYCYIVSFICACSLFNTIINCIMLRLCRTC